MSAGIPMFTLKWTSLHIWQCPDRHLVNITGSSRGSGAGAASAGALLHDLSVPLKLRILTYIIASDGDDDDDDDDEDEGLMWNFPTQTKFSGDLLRVILPISEFPVMGGYLNHWMVYNGKSYKNG